MLFYLVQWDTHSAHFGNYVVISNNSRQSSRSNSGTAIMSVEMFCIKLSITNYYCLHDACLCGIHPQAGMPLCLRPSKKCPPVGRWTLHPSDNELVQSWQVCLWWWRKKKKESTCVWLSTRLRRHPLRRRLCSFMCVGSPGFKTRKRQARLCMASIPPGRRN